MTQPSIDYFKCSIAIPRKEVIKEDMKNTWKVDITFMATSKSITLSIKSICKHPYNRSPKEYLAQ